MIIGETANINFMIFGLMFKSQHYHQQSLTHLPAEQQN
jgi:hypothetical protein